MEDVCVYQFTVRGWLSIEDVNALSPVSLEVEREGAGASVLRARTDQAGMIGVIRHLHGLGLMLEAIRRLPAE
ncbi:MAG TPA: hypothetical protein VHO48_15445 [Anaerolineaceae bacterium]|nr:hypothetical protein [Anaerolineaceae bacterium]